MGTGAGLPHTVRRHHTHPVTPPARRAIKSRSVLVQTHRTGSAASRHPYLSRGPLPAKDLPFVPLSQAFRKRPISADFTPCGSANSRRSYGFPPANRLYVSGSSYDRNYRQSFCGKMTLLSLKGRPVPWQRGFGLSLSK